ncbi:hypothetical protein ACSQ6I_00385 [Anabaena sp. WFMT]
MPLGIKVFPLELGVSGSTSLTNQSGVRSQEEELEVDQNILKSG